MIPMYLKPLMAGGNDALEDGFEFGLEHKTHGDCAPLNGSLLRGPNPPASIKE
jgi:hypothetical protein